MTARAMTSLSPWSRLRLKGAAVRALLGALALALCGCQFPFGKRDVAPQAPMAQQPTCVVLALPASGPYAAIAAKIKRGAATAQQELEASGGSLRLEDVNTEAPNWLEALAALPASCAVVGGPLRDTAYEQAQKAGALEQRAFFSFVPNLKSGDEGARAWRFFPSPQDQIDALVGFTTDDLGIRSYGAFHPGDAYATRMTGLLAQNLGKRHIPLRQASYNKADPTSWSDAAQPLINPVQAEDSGTPVPQTEFEALFLPDSWKNIDMITQSLLYNGEDRLVLLGTTLWEQGLAGKQVPRAENFALAVFPAAWNAQHAPRALKSQGNDFWTALGYDFVNFAAALALDSRLTTPQITARAQRAATMVRGMAPLSYDDAGVAHQKLYLFQVSASGMKPLDAAQFRDTRAAVLERAALRMQGLPSVDAQGNPLVPGAPGAPATPAADTGAALPAASGTAATTPPATPAAPVYDTTPRPSYKLRLPGSR